MTGRLKKCIATVALSGTLRDKLEACAVVGFDGVEIMESDLLTFEGSPADVRKICDDLGLTIEIYQPFRDFEAMPDPQRRRNLDRAERKFDVMQALGTDLCWYAAIHRRPRSTTIRVRPTIWARWRNVRRHEGCALGTRR